MGGIAWSKEEDYLLKKFIQQHGEGKWQRIPVLAGLNRCPKSCRLRWMNYLRPNIRRVTFAQEEIDLIINLHKLFGNRWSLIAGRLAGRTGNDVKNYWNCHLSKKLITTAGEEHIKEKQIITEVQDTRPRSRCNNATTGVNNTPVKCIQHEENNSTTPFQYVQESCEEGAEIIDFDFEEAKLGLSTCESSSSSSSSRSSKWDLDDLILDMEI